MLRKDDTLTIVAYYMFVLLTKSCRSSWIYFFLQVLKDGPKIRKDASLKTFEESTIPDESLYGYHRKCSIHTNKSFKEWLQINKLQQNREKMEGKVGLEVHATNF